MARCSEQRAAAERWATWPRERLTYLQRKSVEAVEATLRAEATATIDAGIQLAKEAALRKWKELELAKQTHRDWKELAAKMEAKMEDPQDAADDSDAADEPMRLSVGMTDDQLKQLAADRGYKVQPDATRDEVLALVSAKGAAADESSAAAKATFPFLNSSQVSIRVRDNVSGSTRDMNHCIFLLTSADSNLDFGVIIYADLLQY